MIIVQTPLRVSFFGGGTDFHDYFLHEGGCALSTSIDKYIFVTIKRRFDELIRVGWTETEMVESVDEVSHELIRESFRLTGLCKGVEITTMGDIPSKGSGLGSSSTVTVGALHSMYALQGELVSAETLAQQACQIEIDILGKPIGVQDQYIAAYGGLRFLRFHTSGSVTAESICLSPMASRDLETNTLLFFTGITRKSASILTEQKANTRERTAVLRDMKQIAYTARTELENGNVDALGELLDESWQLKKQLASKISNPDINELYETAIRAGAIGGKISGAGGGGFLLLYCKPEHQKSVRAALSHLKELPFRLEKDGSKVIFNYRR